MSFWRKKKKPIKDNEKMRELADEFEGWQADMVDHIRSMKKLVPKRGYTFPPMSGDKVVVNGKVGTLVIRRNEDGTVRGMVEFEDGSSAALGPTTEPLVN